MNNREGLNLPDPKEKLTRLLAWLKKRGGIERLPKCEVKASQIGLKDLEDKIKNIPTSHIMIGIIPKGKREKAINIVDKGWADGWAKHYGYEIPHHRHRTKL